MRNRINTTFLTIGFIAVWSAWATSALGTLLALSFIFGRIGGGVLAQDINDIFGFKATSKDLLCLVFGVIIEVGSLVAAFNEKFDEDEDEL